MAGKFDGFLLTRMGPQAMGLFLGVRVPGDRAAQ